MQEFLKAGGLPEGTEVELRSDSCREGVAVKNKSPAGDICDHILIEQSAVVAVDWEPGDSQILVAGCDGDGGWLMTTDGEGVAGSVSISTCDAVVDGYSRGTLEVGSALWRLALLRKRSVVRWRCFMVSATSKKLNRDMRLESAWAWRCPQQLGILTLAGQFVSLR